MAERINNLNKENTSQKQEDFEGLRQERERLDGLIKDTERSAGQEKLLASLDDFQFFTHSDIAKELFVASRPYVVTNSFYTDGLECSVVSRDGFQNLDMEIAEKNS